MKNKLAEWIKIAQSNKLRNGDLMDFDYGDKKILISKAAGKVYATDRICTHAYADLSTGFMNEAEKTVTCPLHMSAFKLDDGTPNNLPAEEPLNTYKVKIQDDWIYILIE